MPTTPAEDPGDTPYTATSIYIIHTTLSGLVPIILERNGKQNGSLLLLTAHHERKEEQKYAAPTQRVAPHAPRQYKTNGNEGRLERGSQSSLPLISFFFRVNCI